MPTGYTAAVQDGAITTFPEFAMQCARAFGALVTMRDDPADAPIPDEFAPSAYHAKKLAETRKEVEDLVAMSADECAAACLAEYERELAAHKERVERRKVQANRYLAMIEQVEAWNPPTPDHVEMKSFMLQQLRDSLEWDCSSKYDKAPERPLFENWRSRKLAELHRTAAYHAEEDAKENERARNRTAWVRALRDSLKKAPTPSTDPA